VGGKFTDLSPADEVFDCDGLEVNIDAERYYHHLPVAG
jgi:hypothetical protein